jgi:hypothetical protein
VTLPASTAEHGFSLPISSSRIPPVIGCSVSRNPNNSNRDLQSILSPSLRGRWPNPFAWLQFPLAAPGIQHRTEKSPPPWMSYEKKMDLGRD